MFSCQSEPFFLGPTLIEPQPRFGGRPQGKFQVVCPQNIAAVPGLGAGAHEVHIYGASVLTVARDKRKALWSQPARQGHTTYCKCKSKWSSYAHPLYDANSTSEYESYLWWVVMYDNPRDASCSSLWVKKAFISSWDARSVCVCSSHLSNRPFYPSTSTLASIRADARILPCLILIVERYKLEAEIILRLCEYNQEKQQRDAIYMWSYWIRQARHTHHATKERNIERKVSEKKTWRKKKKLYEPKTFIITPVPFWGQTTQIPSNLSPIVPGNETTVLKGLIGSYRCRAPDKEMYWYIYTGVVATKVYSSEFMISQGRNSAGYRSTHTASSYESNTAQVFYSKQYLPDFVPPSTWGRSSRCRGIRGNPFRCLRYPFFLLPCRFWPSQCRSRCCRWWSPRWRWCTIDHRSHPCEGHFWKNPRRTPVTTHDEKIEYFVSWRKSAGSGEPPRSDVREQKYVLLLLLLSKWGIVGFRHETWSFYFYFFDRGVSILPDRLLNQSHRRPPPPPSRKLQLELNPGPNPNEKPLPGRGPAVWSLNPNQRPLCVVLWASCCHCD